MQKRCSLAKPKGWQEFESQSHWNRLSAECRPGPQSTVCPDQSWPSPRERVLALSEIEVEVQLDRLRAGLSARHASNGEKEPSTRASSSTIASGEREGVGRVEASEQMGTGQILGFWQKGLPNHRPRTSCPHRTVAHLDSWILSDLSPVETSQTH